MLNTQTRHTFFADGLRLAGILHLPNQAPRAVVIGCHGLMADKHSPKQIDLANHCSALGMAYFRFDHRGCGESEGDLGRDSSLGNRVSDLLAARRETATLLGDGVPTALFGSSLGGTVCLAAAAEITPFCMITLAAPMRSQSIRIPENVPRCLKTGVSENRLCFDIENAVSAAHHLLVIHGSADETVSVENAHFIFNRARDPKRLLILEHGDHRITKKTDQIHYISESMAWIRHCYAHIG